MRLFPLLFAMVLTLATGIISGEEAANIEVRVSLPAALLDKQVLAEVEAACRFLAEKNLREAEAALRRAATGAGSAVLGKNLTAAADAVSRPAGTFRPVAEPGEIGPEPFFALAPRGKGDPPEGLFCLPLPREENWMVPFLEDPSRLRQDLPERISGVTADMSALPRVYMADLAAAEAPGRLSAWVDHPAHPGMVVVFRNLVAAYCDQRLQKLSKRVLAAPWSGKVDAKSLAWLVAMTRVAHGLGPVALEKESGKGIESVASRLKENAPLVEAIKAEALALISGLRLAESEKDFAVTAAGLTATFVIYLLDRVRRFSGESASPFALIANQLIKEGGIRLDLQSGRVIPDRRKIRASMKKLVKRMVRIQGSGSDEEADDFFSRKEKADSKEDPFVGLIPRPIAGFKLVTRAPDPAGDK